jgi:hypothetical protein
MEPLKSGKCRVKNERKRRPVRRNLCLLFKYTEEGGGDDKYMVNVSGAPILPGQITFILQEKHCKKSQLNSSSLCWHAQRQATQHDCQPRLLGDGG